MSQRRDSTRPPLAPQRPASARTPHPQHPQPLPGTQPPLYPDAPDPATPGPGDPTVVFSMDEFGPLNVQPRPGRQWAPVVRRNKKGSTDDPRRRQQRATIDWRFTNRQARVKVKRLYPVLCERE